MAERMMQLPDQRTQQQVLDSGFLTIQAEGHTAFLSRAALPPEAT
jgi:hypothetical protein